MSNTPRTRLKFPGFQGVQKMNIGVKCVNLLISFLNLSMCLIASYLPMFFKVEIETVIKRQWELVLVSLLLTYCTSISKYTCLKSTITTKVRGDCTGIFISHVR